MGLVEISGEEVTQDGYVDHDIADPDLSEKIVRAVDGLKLNGLRLQKAFKAGRPKQWRRKWGICIKLD